MPKISALPAATSVNPADLVAIVQSGTTKRAAASLIGTTARTAAEIAAAVTPVNYTYEPGNILRYGTNTTPGTTDMTAAIQAAVSVAQFVTFPKDTYAISDTIALPESFTGRFDACTFECLAGMSGKPAFTVRSGGRLLGSFVVDGNSVADVIGLQLGGSYTCQQAIIEAIETKYCATGIYLIGDTGKGVYLNNFGHVYSRYNTTGIKLYTVGGTPYEVNANRFGYVSLQNNVTDALLIDGGDGNSFDFLECESNTADAIDLKRARGTFIQGGWIEGNGHNLRIADNPDVTAVYISASCDSALTSADSKFSYTFSTNRQVVINSQQDARFMGRTRIAGDLLIGTDGTVANDQNVVKLQVAGQMNVFRKTDAGGGTGHFYLQGQSGCTGFYFQANSSVPLLDMTTSRASFAVPVTLASHAWNSNQLRLGTYYLWVDSTGDLRIKDGAPANDTDGTIVGTQS